jgi:hypothetical protein
MAAAVTLLAKERRGPNIAFPKRSSIQSLMLTLTLRHTWRTKKALLAHTQGHEMVLG